MTHELWTDADYLEVCCLYGDALLQAIAITRSAGVSTFNTVLRAAEEGTVMHEVCLLATGKRKEFWESISCRSDLLEQLSHRVAAGINEIITANRKENTK